MPILVSGGDAVDAWIRGCNAVSDEQTHTIPNLITEITNPTLVDPAWFSRFDPKAVGASDRLSVVAKVLFPSKPRAATETVKAYLDRHERLLARGLKTGSLHSTWAGTYFQRLRSLDGSEDQIERAIRVLNDWERRAETAIVAHTSTPKLDGLRTRGAPCLQFIEILWRTNNVLDLVAVYRNHDFLNKTLGNFVGLGRLLAFIAAEGGKTPGRVICHSVRAYTSEIGRLRTLILR